MDDVRDEAPARPGRGELAAAGDALVRAMAARRRVAWQVEQAEAALRRRGSWLRPAYRLRLVQEARGRRAALAAAQTWVERTGRRLDELARRVERWREHLAARRAPVSTAVPPGAGLYHRIDELVAAESHELPGPRDIRFQNAKNLRIP